LGQSIFILIFAVAMKKICFLTDSVFTIGGVQRVTAVIAKELAKDHAVTIVTLDNRDGYNPALYGLGSTDITFRFFSYPTLPRWKQKLYKVYSGLYRNCRLQTKLASDLYAHSSFPADLRKALLKELKAGDYDVIIGVHAPLAVRLATLRKDLPRTRLIGWIHNSFEALFSDTSLYIGADRKRHYVYQFRKLDDVVVLCQHDAETYRHYDHRFLPTVIYNPLTLAPGRPSTGHSERFLAVGRFSRRHKGFDLLIEAFHLFAEKNKTWKLDLVGEGEEEEMYRTLIRKYHLEDRVSIHPFTNDIQAYYSAAQIYVLSSRWEGFGLVLVEAMAHGLPVVSSDLPTSLEIMGSFGLYFKNGDIGQLAGQLYAATQLDWQQKSKEALGIARHFDVETIRQQWKQLIEK
jgi:glycosyltransferase involved in cell wall biosynthesis